MAVITKEQVKRFFEDESAQAMVEYSMLLSSYILWFFAIRFGFEEGYGKYVEGLYYVLGLPVP